MPIERHALQQVEIRIAESVFEAKIGKFRRQELSPVIFISLCALGFEFKTLWVRGGGDGEDFGH